MTTDAHDDGWELPFARQEYAERLARLRALMAERGLDLLYVTSPPNLNYLLGHECVWFDGRNVTGLMVPRDASTTIYFDTPDHQANWPPTIEETVAYGEHEFYYPGGLEAVVRTSGERGWLPGRVGLEYWSWAPGGPALAELAQRLTAAGAEVVDGSFAVDHVRLVKSPRELEYTRKALAIADQVYGSLADALAPGMSEKEVAAVMYSEAFRGGSDEPGIRNMIRSGDETAAFHRSASERRIQAGELLSIDMSCAYKHYTGNTARALSLGANPFWADALAKLDEALWETTAKMQPGDPTMKLQGLMDAAVDRAGLRDYVWWVGGYVIGIAFPPDWVGHVYLNDEEGFEPGIMEPGFVANWEVQIWDVPKGEGVGLIDTMIMTDKGIELPATFPRTLNVV